MNILFVDTETTGTNPEKHSIIEIACEYHKDGKLISKFHSKFISNTAIIDMGALRVNKNTTETLMEIGKAKSESKAAFEFMDYLLTLDNKNLDICGHNPIFDVSFLKAMLTRHGIEGWDQAVSYRMIDTCDRAKMLIETGIINLGSLGLRGSSLTNVAKALGIEVDENATHGAVYDVDLCARVYYKMNEILSNRRG